MSAAKIWSSNEPVLIPNVVSNISPNSRKSLFRVGLWPITSETEPETGMGIDLVLSALLEQWPSVCVYRLVAQVSGTPSNYQWKITDTQFGVNDWEIEGLDENVAIWGNFETQKDGIHLKLEVEDDARQDDSVLELKYDSATLGEMLNQLPDIATKIMNWLKRPSENSKYASFV